MLSWTIRKCQQDDLEDLLVLAKTTFVNSFAHLNNPADFESYIEEAFTLENFRQQLSNPDSYFYFVRHQDIIGGYLKLNVGAAQTDVHDEKAIEIERIYVRQQFHGQGLGKMLFDKATEMAKSLEKDYIWLGVWEVNDQAINFYKRQGFEAFGKHSFFIGSDEQTDILFRVSISSD